MYRRTFLGGISGATLTASAGCLSRVFEDTPDGVILGPQKDQVADSEDLAYPAYGQPLPAFELPDPLTEARVNTETLDRTAVITAFFATCPAECGILLNQLAGVQGMIGERGITDGAVFLPVTFDPDRDDAEALRANAEMVGADLEAGNWRYLRPETSEDAKRIVQDELGMGFEKQAESDRVQGYDFAHVVVTLLVNPDGVVERAYRGENLDRNRVADDIETVVDG